MQVLAKRYIHVRMLCLILLIAAAVVAVPLLGAKGGQVPFHASFNTVFQSHTPPPILTISVQGEGQADHLGRTTTNTDDQQSNLAIGQSKADYVLVAANGDCVMIHDETNDAQIPGGVSFIGTYTVTGGTGRFAGATGSGTLIGTAHFTDQTLTVGFGEFTLDGTISSPGSLK